jgi:hypothetical protein
MRRGNRLNGFLILAWVHFTWLKPGVNETEPLRENFDCLRGLDHSLRQVGPASAKDSSNDSKTPPGLF